MHHLTSILVLILVIGGVVGQQCQGQGTCGAATEERCGGPLTPNTFDCFGGHPLEGNGTYVHCCRCDYVCCSQNLFYCAESQAVCDEYNLPEGPTCSNYKDFE